MWLSASAFFSQYWKVYSPVNFAKKYDPQGKFVKNFLPCLKNYDSKFIYEPWKASKEQQKRWGCIIGEDYPERIIDQDSSKQENLEKMKLYYSSSSSTTKKTKATPKTKEITNKKLKTKK